MDLIWAKREAIYFCDDGWTGSISLIGFAKFAVWRKGWKSDSLSISLSAHAKSVRDIRSSTRPKVNAVEGPDSLTMTCAIQRCLKNNERF
jgi:hypothetical protein